MSDSKVPQGKRKYRFNVSPFRHVDPETKDILKWTVTVPVSRFPIKGCPTMTNKVYDLKDVDKMYGNIEGLDSSYYTGSVTVDDKNIVITAKTEVAVRNTMNKFVKEYDSSSDGKYTKVRIVRSWDVRVMEYEDEEISGESGKLISIWSDSEDDE